MTKKLKENTNSKKVAPEQGAPLAHVPGRLPGGPSTVQAWRWREKRPREPKTLDLNTTERERETPDPDTKDIRSLNLSTAAGIAIYESLRSAKSFHAWSVSWISSFICDMFNFGVLE